MTCKRFHRLIDAYVDGECEAGEPAALRAHLRVCPDCRQHAVQLSALQDLVNHTLSAETAPPHLWHRVTARLDQERAVPVVAPRRAPRANIPRLIAAAAIVALVVGGVMMLAQSGRQPEQAVIRETVEDLATFALSRRPFDIAANDPAVVRAWFAGKIRFTLPLLKARAAGYELIGSRLCWLLGRRVGAFTYQQGERFMTLYVLQGDGVELSGGWFDPVLGTTAVRHRATNYGSLVWRQGELVFSLVSDAPDEEMTTFAAAVIGPGEEAAVQPSGIGHARLSPAESAGTMPEPLGGDQ